jgi:amino acid transporter
MRTLEETMLEKNLGTADRWIRIVIGIALVSLTFAGPHTMWGLVGVVPLATAFAGTCPLYTLFGLRTCKV